jgi:hypothetical protein
MSSILGDGQQRDGHDSDEHSTRDIRRHAARAAMLSGEYIGLHAAQDTRANSLELRKTASSHIG